MLLTGKTITGATVKLNAITAGGGIFKFPNLCAERRDRLHDR